MTRRVISCFRGRATISVPNIWVVGFNYRWGFAYVGREARIRFPAVHRAFGISLDDGPSARVVVRELTWDQEVLVTPWGPLRPPWEPYTVAQRFGHAPPICLDQVWGVEETNLDQPRRRRRHHRPNGRSSPWTWVYAEAQSPRAR